jgi:parB domain protein nuclease
MQFNENYPVKELKAADYNPRKINKSAFRKLKESITKFGIVKPIIINSENGILTAGHQRTKALKDLNIKFVPVIKLEGIKKSDEIMFNLFHNSIETNLSSVQLNNIKNLSNELNKYFQEVAVLGNENKSNIYAICKKPLRYPIKDYNKVLNIEFNMEYPNGFKHNMHKKLVNTILESLD